MTGTVLKSIALAATVLVGAAMLAPQPAEAGRRNAAPFIAGLAIGAIVGGAIASDRRGYDAPPPVRYHRPRRWTPEWYDYCFAKYRSFDPHSGTYQPYHGPRRLCR